MESSIDTATPSSGAPHESPSVTVAEAVAEEDGVSPLSLSPIATAIDTDALDALVESLDGAGEITFSYADYLVTVTGDGQIDLEPELD